MSAEGESTSWPRRLRDRKPQEVLSLKQLAENEIEEFSFPSKRRSASACKRRSSSKRDRKHAIAIASPSKAEAVATLNPNPNLGDGSQVETGNGKCEAAAVTSVIVDNPFYILFQNPLQVELAEPERIGQLELASNDTGVSQRALLPTGNATDPEPYQVEALDLSLPEFPVAVVNLTSSSETLTAPTDIGSYAKIGQLDLLCNDVGGGVAQGVLLPIRNEPEPEPEPYQAEALNLVIPIPEAGLPVAPSKPTVEQKTLMRISRRRKKEQSVEILKLRNKLVGERYKIMGSLGCGSMGLVVSALDIFTNKMMSVKITLRDDGDLSTEKNVLLHLAENGAPGFPEARWYGMFEGRQALVMTLHGPSLHYLWSQKKLNLSLKTVANIGRGCLDLLDSFHKVNFVHCDVKPGNILLLKNETSCRKLCLVDFGLTILRNYEIVPCDPTEDDDIQGICGTLKYASIRIHEGKVPAAVDDCESLVYTLIDLLTRDLPWMNAAKAPNGSRHQLFKKMKAEFRQTIMKPKKGDEGAENTGLLECFKNMLIYVWTLSVNETPDYELLKRFLQREAFGDDDPESHVPEWCHWASF